MTAAGLKDLFERKRRAMIRRPSFGHTTAQARVRHYVLGRSEEGRPIRAIERGDPAAPKRLLVFGLIHGNGKPGLQWR